MLVKTGVELILHKRLGKPIFILLKKTFPSLPLDKKKISFFSFL